MLQCYKLIYHIAITNGVEMRCKMIVKRWVAISAVAVAVSAVLAGCSSQKQPQQPAAPAAEAQASAEAGATEETVAEDATVLKDAFQNDFSVGVAVKMAAVNDDAEMEFVGRNFNSITMENDMKPESLLDWEASEKSKDGMPEIRKEHLGRVLGMAKEKGMKLRGHCLVWHSQTPEWFFSKDFEPSKGLVDKETMKKRMEVYLQKVLTYCQDNFPGVVYAWDVVNEAMADGGGYRTESNWYQTYGDESYITDAFTFARKYAASEVKLFYNDYNEYVPAKRDLIVELLKDLRGKGLVDGMGMQSHWDMSFPSVDMLGQALEEYGKIDGMEIQFTEIDMHNTDNSKEGLQKQAERYKQFFETILRADRTGTANVTNVTFWGMDDEVTWLSGFKGETSYPLLFDADHKEKPCFGSILETAKEAYK